MTGEGGCGPPPIARNPQLVPVRTPTCTQIGPPTGARPGGCVPRKQTWSHGACADPSRLSPDAVWRHHAAAPRPLPVQSIGARASRRFGGAMSCGSSSVNRAHQSVVALRLRWASATHQRTALLGGMSGGAGGYARQTISKTDSDQRFPTQFLTPVSKVGCILFRVCGRNGCFFIENSCFLRPLSTSGGPGRGMRFYAELNAVRLLNDMWQPFSATAMPLAYCQCDVYDGAYICQQASSSQAACSPLLAYFPGRLSATRDRPAPPISDASLRCHLSPKERMACGRHDVIAHCGPAFPPSVGIPLPCFVLLWFTERELPHGRAHCVCRSQCRHERYKSAVYPKVRHFGLKYVCLI